MPFGVELPENLGESPSQSDTGNAPDPKPSPQPGTGDGSDGPIPIKDSSKVAKPEIAKELLDLDKLERFRFGGRELTPKELREAQLRHQDYTKKTQEVAEARKYADNFHIDLQRVLRDPQLMAQFRTVYPKQYQKAAEELLRLYQGQKPDQASQDTTTQLPREIVEKLQSFESKLGELEQDKHQAQTEKDAAWLDNQLESNSKKYPNADQEVILARLELAERQGTKIDDKLVERLFAAHDKDVSMKWEKRYKEKVDQQLKAGFKAKDVGQGGGIPTGEPRGFKTIKEATQGFLKDIAASK